MGNPKDLLLPKEYPAVGQWCLEADLGPPDHIIAFTAWDVPAQCQDMWWGPEVASNIKESRCIKAVETLPSKDAHGSTHHANSHFLTKNEEGEWETYGRLSEYAYGKLGEVARMGACRTAPADSRVGWSIHTTLTSLRFLTIRSPLVSGITMMISMKPPLITKIYPCICSKVEFMTFSLMASL
jgi:hypothetical protein